MSRVLRVLVLFWSVCLVVWGQVAQAAPQRDRCVILVSVDGLAAFYLDDPKADMPTVNRLARKGARASGMVYIPDQSDLLPACVVWEPRMRPGTNLGKIPMIDIAPTIARILGVPLPTADGKPLRAIVGNYAGCLSEDGDWLPTVVFGVAAVQKI